MTETKNKNNNNNNHGVGWNGIRTDKKQKWIEKCRKKNYHISFDCQWNYIYSQQRI